MRVLGGSRRQLRMAQASEFAAIGLLSGLVAAIAASILSNLIATRVFDLPWQPNWALAIAGGALGRRRTDRRIVPHPSRAGCAAFGDVAGVAGLSAPAV